MRIRHTISYNWGRQEQKEFAKIGKSLNIGFNSFSIYEDENVLISFRQNLKNQN